MLVLLYSLSVSYLMRIPTICNLICNFFHSKRVIYDNDNDNEISQVID